MSDGLPSLTGKGNGSLAAVLSDAQYLELIMGAGSFHSLRFGFRVMKEHVLILMLVLLALALLEA